MKANKTQLAIADFISQKRVLEQDIKQKMLAFEKETGLLVTVSVSGYGGKEDRNYIVSISATI